jgi:hypothetical protein
MGLGRRIDQLISGAVKAENAGEFALVKSYTRAHNGQSLMNLIIDMAQEIDYYGMEEYEMFILGYALGQKDFLDKINGLDLSRISKNEDEETH